jgi:tRNA A37 methylthiotransferase MiaB
MFPFSALEPTPAWHRRHDAPSQHVVQRRIERLTEVEQTLAEKYRSAFMGRKMVAVVENSAGPAGYKYQAMTDRYLTVAFNSDTPVSPRTLVELEITGQHNDCLTGKFVKTMN